MRCECDCGHQRGKGDAEIEFSGTIFFLGMLSAPVLVGFFCGIYKSLEFLGEKF